jgi:hypothetical protein
MEDKQEFGFTIGLAVAEPESGVNWFFRLVQAIADEDMKVAQSKERPQKILIAMHELAGGTTRSLKYEDIVVKAFQMFPEEFSLRGHPEFPDSSDIHKPLYGPLKRHGFVRAAHKSFALTASGVEFVRKIGGASGKAMNSKEGTERLSRDSQAEIDRMIESAAFRFFVEGKSDKILDTDFYAFLGCTVRTPRNEFLGRLERSENAVVEANRLRYPQNEAAAKLSDTLGFVKNQFKDIIQRRRQGK